MTDLNQKWPRRKFISAMGIAGAGAALFNPWTAWATGDLDPRVAKIVADTMGIDTHNHIDVPLNTAELPGPDINLVGEMKRSGLSAICMTFAVDYQKLQNPGDGYESFKNGLNALDKQLAAGGLKRALSLADLKAAHKAHKPAVIQSVEGGHFLEGHLDRLEEAYNRGLRHLGLLHDNDAAVPIGDVFTNPPRWGGLTAFGADVIKECNRLGILVDLSHANNEAVAAALKVATKPVLVSHTGLDTRLGNNPDFARMMKPRLISNEQAKIIAGAGGVIGVWTHLAENPLEYAQNIKAMVDVAGIEHVCIGTDTKLTPPYRPPGAFNGPPPGGKQNGPQSERPPGPPPGGPQNRERAGERTNFAWEGQTAGFYYVVVDALLKVGFNTDEIAKIGGGNFCRIFDAATGRG